MAELILFTGDGEKVTIPLGGVGVSEALKGLKYAAWGDSLTDYQSCANRPQTYTGVDLQGIQHTDEPVIGYLDEIEKRYGCVCTNYGRGGHAAVGDYPNLVAHDFSDVALVTLAYGTNDARQDRAIGTADSKDFTTFAGALSMMLFKIYMDNPACKVLVMTCPQRLTVHDIGTWTPNGVGKTLADYADMTKAVAIRRSTAVVDIFGESGLNQVTLFKDTREGVHPLNSGYKRMSELVIPAIDDLLCVNSESFSSMTIPPSPLSDDPKVTEVPLTADLFTVDGWRWNSTDMINGVGRAKQVGKGIKLIPGKTYLYDFYTTYDGLPERNWAVSDSETAIFGAGCWDKWSSERGFSDPKKDRVIGNETYYKWTSAIAVPKESGPWYIWPMYYNDLGVESLRLRYW